MIRCIALFLILALQIGVAYAQETMRLAVTTSFHNSGLADVLLPQIRSDLGFDVHLLVVGTGQALKLGRAGDVDAVLVHARTAEEAFVAQGHATHRREIMYNDFVLIGPQSDPANVADASFAVEALTNIARARVDFVSRGDDSGTHKAEQALWQTAGIAPEGAWFKSVGAGMGAALNTASALGAYILSDRASWLNFGNKGRLKLLFAGDPALFNQYAYLPVNPARHSHIKAELAQALENWLTSPRAAGLINGYQLNGTQLFFFNAKARP